MRAPIAAGFLAGLIVSIVAIAAGAMLLVSRPSPAGPRPTDVAAGSPSPVATAPATPQPSLPSASASPGTTTAGSPPLSPSAGVSEPGVGLAVGDRAPPLRVAQLGGGEIDTSLLRGQPLWVNFMATYCPSCRDELPLMERFQQDLGESMTILVVDVGEDVDTVASYMTSLGVDLPVGVDPENVARDEWGAFVLPVHYWVDAEGTVRAFFFGPGGPEPFIEGVRSVLPDAELKP